MSLADQHAARPAPHISPRRSAPTGWEPGVRYEAGIPSEVTLSLREVPEDEQAWREEIRRVYGIDLPESRQVQIAQLRHWGDPASPMIYVRYAITDRAEARQEIDAATIIRTIRATPRRKTRATRPLTRVLVGSDAQAGKTDHRGGTDALIDRIRSLTVGLEEVMREVPCEDAVLADPGDLVEGFESTAQQAFTNDLSHPDQLAVARHITAHLVSALSARHAATRVLTVPSNHGAWRKGKDRLGRPGDDYGIDVHRAVAEAFQLAGRTDVSWLIPQPWEEALSIQVRGAVLGMAHGHQVSRPDGVPDWWAKQTHGGGPLAAATILLTGHYHHARIQPTGQIDGRDRWWMQAPTLDNGSAWFRNGSGGSDSEPGLLTFTIDDHGRWDHLRLITHDDIETLEETT